MKVEVGGKYGIYRRLYSHWIIESCSPYKTIKGVGGIQLGLCRGTKKNVRTPSSKLSLSDFCAF